MEKCHKDVLRLNTVFLTRNVNVEAVCLNLIEKGFFIYSHIDDLLTPLRSMNERCLDMLFLLNKRGPNAWDTFLTSLDETGQHNISARLRQVLILYKENPQITSDDIRKFFWQAGS